MDQSPHLGRKACFGRLRCLPTLMLFLPIDHGVAWVLWGEAQASGLYADFQVPEQLDWDAYLGPITKDVPYHPIYHPFHWRGWVDFGVGALGDMGAHLIDHPYWALGLTYPTHVEATSTPVGRADR